MPWRVTRIDNLMKRTIATSRPIVLVYDELEAWAEYQGRPVANLAAYLVESSIREAKEKGEFKTMKDKESQKGE